MDKETLEMAYWFYSTLAQVIGAFIAIVGLFAVYALQKLNNDIDSLTRDVFDLVAKSESVPRIRALPPKKLVSLIKENPLLIKNDSCMDQCEEIVDDIKQAESQIQYIKKDTPKVIKSLIILLAVSLSLIVFCKYFGTCLNIIFVFIILIYSLFIFQDSYNFFNKIIVSKSDKTEDS